MKTYMKNLISIILILILLPMISTIIIQGKEVMIENSREQSELEMILPGAVASCISEKSPMEALKAQTVIIRTMLLNTKEKDSIKAMESAKINYNSDFSENIEAAVRETEGEIITYHNEPIKPAFHAVSAGKTRNMGEIREGTLYPYLSSVSSKWDKESDDYLSTVTVDSISDNIVINSRDSAGYVLNISVGEETMTGEEFKDKYHLNSSNFSYKKQQKKVTFTVRGVGHGIGLSQYGAIQMAQEGKDYEEIIKYYFKNTEISLSYE